MKVWVIGHYGSCNMGDKYQPHVVADFLLNNTDYFGTWNKTSNISFVNYSEGDEDMYFKVGKTKQLVSHPKLLESMGEEADLAILTTGSMDCKSPYVSWIADFLQKGIISKLIIWGGFSRGENDFTDFATSLKFLKNDKIFYYARSFNDLQIFNSITQSSRGRLAGDPMCYWVTEADKKFGNILGRENGIEIKDDSLIVVPSAYSFIYNEEYWTTMCNKADYIICADTVSDNNIINNYNHKSFDTDKPWTYLELIEKSRHVISGRLHASVLSAAIGVPTTMIITDSADPGTGTFKFDAVGNTSSGISTPLCSVLKCNEALLIIGNHFPPRVENANNATYLKLTLDSLKHIAECCF